MNSSSAQFQRIPRQKRFANTDTNLEAEIQGKRFPVRNFSRFGLGIAISKLAKSFPLECRVDLYYGQERIYSGRVCFRHRRLVPEQDAIIGLQLEAELPVESLSAQLSVTAIRRELATALEAQIRLKPEFRQLVDKLTYFFAHFKESVEEQERKYKEVSTGDALKYRNALQGQLVQAMQIELSTMGHEFERIFGRIDSTTMPQDVLRYLQHRLKPYFDEAEICRAREDLPVGYHGHVENVDMIKRRGFEGRTLFGQVLHHCVVNSNIVSNLEARRVRLSVELNEVVKHTLTRQKEVRVLFVAGGPCLEVSDFLLNQTKQVVDKCEFHFVDFNEQMLLKLQTSLTRLMNETAKSLKHRFIFCPQGASHRNAFESFVAHLDPHNELQRYDLILAPAVFDYLKPTSGRLLSQKLYEALNPGGEILYSRFAEGSPSRAFFLCLVDWSMLPVSEGQLHEQTPRGAKLEIEKEPMSLNYFCTLTKAA